VQVRLLDVRRVLSIWERRQLDVCFGDWKVWFDSRPRPKVLGSEKKTQYKKWVKSTRVFKGKIRCFKPKKIFDFYFLSQPKTSAANHN